MDARYELKGISFVWNLAKAGENARRHGVTCEQAAEVFFDPFIRLVDASTETEARDAVIGLDEAWNMVYVVHIQLEGDLIRIISARKATQSERLLYEEQ